MRPSYAAARRRIRHADERSRVRRGFGDQAEVLRAESLRREMKAELLAAMQQYE
jgi:predicted DNA-binding transcriptional regulator YafY